MEDLQKLCIRGHHIYKKHMESAVGEVLVCEREPHNAAYRYSIAITKGGVVVDIYPENYRNCVCSFCDEVVQYIAQ